MPGLELVTCHVWGTVGVTKQESILATLIHVALSPCKVRGEPGTRRWQSVVGAGSRLWLAGRGGGRRFFFDTVHAGLVEGCRLCRKLWLQRGVEKYLPKIQACRFEDKKPSENACQTWIKWLSDGTPDGTETRGRKN